MTIQNCIADTNNRFSYNSAAYNLKTNFAELDTDASGGLNPEEANGQVGGIRLAGADGEEGTEDDDLHRFAHIDTDGSDELSEAELDANYVPSAGSPSIDAGVDSATVGVTLTTDYNGNARPQGAGYDIGAFEVAPPAE